MARYDNLVKRLKDKTFNNKFRSNSFDERLLTKMDEQTDEIISFTLAYMALCFIYDGSTPRTMLQVYNNGIMTMLARMLGSKRDITAIAKDRSTGMSKSAQSQVAELRTMVEKSAAFNGGDTTVISPQIMALKVTDLLVRRFRERGSKDEILSKEILARLMDILASFADATEYPKTLKTHGLQLLELPISTLEAYTMGGYGSLEAHVSGEDLAALARLFSAVSGWQCADDVAHPTAQEPKAAAEAVQ